MKEAISSPHAPKAIRPYSPMIRADGSGKLSPRLKDGAEPHLKEYFSTLEEARADLMALWNVSDKRLQELGLVSHPDVAKAMYYNAVRTVLTQLMRNLQEQFFGILEVQVSERNAPALALFRGLGFEQVDVGRAYRKELAR